jgi:hypothetical protein
MNTRREKGLNSGPLTSAAGAAACENDQAELATLADSAHTAAERACKTIDDSLAFIAASEKRIAKMESRK